MSTLQDITGLYRRINKILDELKMDEFKLNLQEYNKIKLKNGLKPVYVFRSSLCQIMNHLWNIKEKKENDLLYNHPNDGCKYALNVIGNKDNKEISKKICVLHMSLNNKYDLKKQSINIIYESINDIKNLIKYNLMPELYIDINNDIINEFEELVNKYKYLFL